MSREGNAKPKIVILGAGLTGMAAACFAANRGLNPIIIGWSHGEMPFASGLLDLLGVYPLSSRAWLEKPWEGLAELVSQSPEHPYARLGLEEIREAWEEFLKALEEGGLSYHSSPDENNSILPTAAGTIRRTWQVPRSMWPGVVALREQQSAIIVDFHGMKEFSALQITEALRPVWPDLKPVRITFPYPFQGPDRHNLLLAEAIESPEVREQIAEAVGKEAAGFDSVGFPAILGLRRHETVLKDLTERLGKPVFEIPTLPPSVPGHRLVNALCHSLSNKGVELITGRRVLSVGVEGRTFKEVTSGRENFQEKTAAAGMLLATGRFLGGGLAADLKGVRETLMNLHVHQPQDRKSRHRLRFLDSLGHPLNRSGLLIDEHFRPLDKSGQPVLENAFAAGSILAHQDWMREKCGSGLAIATAYGAIRSFMHCCETHSPVR